MLVPLTEDSFCCDWPLCCSDSGPCTALRLSFRKSPSAFGLPGVMTATEFSSTSPALKVQSFQLADGSLRYYARAEWDSAKDPTGLPNYLLAAWILPLPTPHILSVEKQTSSYGGINDGAPNLLNVIDLGNGKTGVIVAIRGDDSLALVLAEYHDGLSVQKMPILQSIGAGE